MLDALSGQQKTNLESGSNYSTKIIFTFIRFSDECTLLSFFVHEYMLSHMLKNISSHHYRTDLFSASGITNIGEGEEHYRTV